MAKRRRQVPWRQDTVLLQNAPPGYMPLYLAQWLLGVTRETVNRYVKTDVLVSVKVLGKTCVSIASVERRFVKFFGRPIPDDLNVMIAHEERAERYKASGGGRRRNDPEMAPMFKSQVLLIIDERDREALRKAGGGKSMSAGLRTLCRAYREWERQREIRGEHLTAIIAKMVDHDNEVREKTGRQPERALGDLLDVIGEAESAIRQPAGS